MPIAPNPIDLTTIDTAKYQLANFSSANQADNDLLQLYITAFSQFFIDQTGVESAPLVSDALIIASPFTGICHYTEFYDGNGHNRLYPDNGPLQLINLLQIGNYVAPLSTSISMGGYYIERGKKSIAFRSGYGSGYTTSVGWTLGAPYCFDKGTGNVFIDYNAGYAVTPADIENAANVAIAQNYKRRETVDQASKAMNTSGGGSATIRFRDWVLPPEVVMVMQNHTRLAVKT